MTTIVSQHNAAQPPINAAESPTWRMRIHHRTTYKYSGTVHTSFNEARLTPLSLPWQTTLHNQFTVSPTATAYRYTDYWATAVTAFELHAPHDRLEVSATSLVEATAPPAAVPTDWATLRSAKVRDRYAEFLTPTTRTKVDQRAIETAMAIVAGAPPQIGAEDIAEWVRANVTYVPGSTGVQAGAQDVWRMRQGVCQDIAHLTIALLRSVGIPARYVSGYVHPEVDAEIGATIEGQSHAWVEWWCQSWIPYDPTNGTGIGQRHVTVARGRDYDDVPPLKGVYNGAPRSELDVSVEITRLA